MDDTIDTAVAPVEPIAPVEPTSAADAAVLTGDQGAFKEAFRAEQAGKPLPPVDAAKPAALIAPVEPEHALSKRQQDLNTKMREAVERATAPLEAELARLRSQTRTEPPAPAPATQADYKRFLAMPDAPKLAEFDTLEDHSAAVALFIADKRFEERESVRQQGESRSRIQQSLEDRNTAFRAQVADATKEKPDFLDQLSPEVQALRPRDALQPGDKAGPLNDVADCVMRSPIASTLLQHFTDHPEELQRLAALPSPQAVLFEMGALHGRLHSRTADAAPALQPKHITSAPPPPTTLGTRPTETTDPLDAAVKSGDQGAFKAAFYRQLAADLR